MKDGKMNSSSPRTELAIFRFLSFVLQLAEIAPPIFQSANLSEQFQPIAKQKIGGAILAHCKMKHRPINSSPIQIV
jgi:hypothetical protein